MPDEDKKKEPRNESRIVIESPLTAPREPSEDMDRYGRIKAYRYMHKRAYERKPDTRRA